MKKYILPMVCVLIVMSFLFIYFYSKSRKPVMETFNVDSVTREEITDELIVALFIKILQVKLQSIIQTFIWEKLKYIIMR